MVILKSSFRHRVRIAVVATLLFGLPFLAAITIVNPTRAVNFCTSDKCKEAEAAEKAATAAAAAAAAAADSAEAEVARLRAENAALTATINKNLAVAEDLAARIAENEAKLDTQQTALANLLVDMHFDGDTSALMILASAETISDLAERQSRKDTVKTQIAAATDKIRELKADLESQKSQVDAIIADQKNQRAQIEANEQRAVALIAKYSANAAAYSADAAEARKIKEEEIAAEIARLNSSGVIAAGVDSYPWRDNCPGDNLRYGTGGQYGGSWGYVCQCVSYAGWKAYEHWRVTISGWGNAKNWGTAARARGYRVDNNPAPFTIAVSTAGTYGHVMWVESVNANGTVNLSEYNNSYSSASHKPGDYGYRTGVSTKNLQFIHFN